MIDHLVSLLEAEAVAGEALASVEGRVYREMRDQTFDDRVSFPCIAVESEMPDLLDTAQGSKWHVYDGVIYLNALVSFDESDDRAHEDARTAALTLQAGLERVIAANRAAVNGTYPEGVWHHLEWSPAVVGPVQLPRGFGSVGGGAFMQGGISISVRFARHRGD